MGSTRLQHRPGYARNENADPRAMVITGQGRQREDDEAGIQLACQNRAYVTANRSEGNDGSGDEAMSRRDSCPDTCETVHTHHNG